MSGDTPDKLRPAARVEPSVPPSTEPADEVELYDVMSPEPAPATAPGAGPAAAAGAGPAIWHVAREGGPREGPFDVEEVRRRLRTGELRPGDLVWRDGMPDWQPARSVAELSAARAKVEGPPSLPITPGRDAGVDLNVVASRVNRVFSQPLFYRVTGYVAGGIAIGTFFLSLIGAYWRYTWFDGAAIFALMFVVCQAAAALLERERSGD